MLGLRSISLSIILKISYLTRHSHWTKHDIYGRVIARLSPNGLNPRGAHATKVLHARSCKLLVALDESAGLVLSYDINIIAFLNS
jgi:hypothetical protein